MEKSFRGHSIISGSLLLFAVLFSYRAAGQEPLCACITAWQQGIAAPAGCPHIDSAGRYDRSAKSYILFAGNDASAQATMKQMIASVRDCASVGAAYQMHADYDQVQMNDVYSFLPTTSPSVAGKAAVHHPKMELRLKSGASSSAVLLNIVGNAPIPGGEPAFISATQNLLKEWRAAQAEKKTFAAPKAGWASVYPAARYLGVDAAVGKYETGSVYRYEWRGGQGAAEALQQSLIQALGKIPEVMGNASQYTEATQGKSIVAGYRLMPPNPQIRIETSVDKTEQAGTVRLSIIVPDGKKDR